MTFRGLLAPLFHSPEDRLALDTAYVLANRFQAHVDALLVKPDPMDVIPIVGEGVSADAIERLRESAEATIELQRRATETVFAKASEAADIAVVEGAEIVFGRPSVTLREVTGQSEDVVPGKAMFSDLVVFGAAWSKKAPALRPTFEAVLLRARRPILLAPAEPFNHLGQNVAVAWNGAPEARSALDAAMPFLSEAAAVHILTVGNVRANTDSLDEIMDYLTWHGIGSEAHLLDTGSEPAGAVLMQKAKAIGADLLVMGGYGHMRLRERILGGVTHHIVNQPGLPILIAH